MEITDIIAGAILAFFFIRGWRRGFMVSVLQIVGIIAGYIAAIVVVKNWGTDVAEALGWPRITAMPLLGMITYIGVGIIFSIISGSLTKEERKKAKAKEFQRSFGSSMGGAVISLGSGALLLALAFYMLDLLNAGPLSEKLPDISESKASEMTQNLAYKTASIALPKTEGNADRIDKLARTISEPSQNLAKVREVLQSESVQNMFADPQLIKSLLDGDADRVAGSQSVQQFFQDQNTMDTLTNLGMIDDQMTRETFSMQLAEVGATAQRKMDDPKVQEYIRELQEDELLSSEKIPQLLRDGRFLRLLDLLLIGAPEPDQS